VAWIRRYPFIADTALALAVLAVSVPPVSAISGKNHGLSFTLVIALVCALAWRRRAPFTVFLAMSGLALVQFAATPELNVDIAMLVAFYTVAAYEPPKRVLIAAIMMEAGAVLAAVTVAHTLGVSLLLSGTVAAAGLLGYYARTRRAYLEALVDRADRLEREQDQQAQLAAAAERTRIAREVHDIVAHNIAVMIALAEGAAYTAPASTGQAVELMGQVSETGRSALTDMRRLLGVLRAPAQPERTPQPTLDDIEDLLATIRTAGLPVRLTVTGQPYPLPAAAQLALYRMTQEALTNTLKHAPGAAGAQVRLTYLPGEVGLEITDAGCPGAVTSSGTGHGIAGMRERAAVFGGKVTAGPRPGGGWRVHTVLPLSWQPAREGR
jgi:signal transduction histidine kinase